MPTKDSETVTASCGCVFCDLDLEPEMVDDKRMHVVPDRDIYGTTQAVPCTNPEYDWHLDVIRRK
jgi:hypothetical protein